MNQQAFFMQFNSELFECSFVKLLIMKYVNAALYLYA